MLNTPHHFIESETIIGDILQPSMIKTIQYNIITAYYNFIRFYFYYLYQQKSRRVDSFLFCHDIGKRSVISRNGVKTCLP